MKPLSVLELPNYKVLLIGCNGEFPPWCHCSREGQLEATIYSKLGFPITGHDLTHTPFLGEAGKRGRRDLNKRFCSLGQ